MSSRSRPSSRAPPTRSGRSPNPRGRPSNSRAPSRWKQKGLRETIAQPFVVSPPNLALKHFRAKWIPVCVKKTRQNKNLEHQPFLHQNPAAVLDLLDLRDGGREMVGFREHGRRRAEDIHELVA